MVHVIITGFYKVHTLALHLCLGSHWLFFGFQRRDVTWQLSCHIPPGVWVEGWLDYGNTINEPMKRGNW